MPLHRRLPKRGFRNTAFQLELNEINLGTVQAAIDAGSLDAKNPVDVDGLVKAGLLSRARDGVKLLGDGETQGQGRFHGMARLQVRDRGGGEGRRFGENPRARQGSADAEPRGKNARFAAGLDKPKIVEAAPTPTKAEPRKRPTPRKRPDWRPRPTGSRPIPRAKSLRSDPHMMPAG